MNGKVVSLNVGEPRLVTYRGLSFRTGIFKMPAGQPLILKKLNFVGDGQADLSAHGGIDKAVYCYPIEHYDFWRSELGRAALPMGQFGENVTTQGVLETELRIGDVLEIGSAIVQVSEPRIPCYKLVMRMEAGSDFAVRFLAANRTGFYCRVLHEGIVKTADALTLLQSDASSPTVSEVVAATQFADRDPAALRRVRKARGISAKWQSRVRRMIDAEVRRRSETGAARQNSFVVDETVRETKDVLSLWLRPADGARVLRALPGQYVTLLWADGMTRTYSVSAVDTERRYRITVKLVRDAQGCLGRASARAPCSDTGFKALGWSGLPSATASVILTRTAIRELQGWKPVFGQDHAQRKNLKLISVGRIRSEKKTPCSAPPTIQKDVKWLPQSQ